MTVTTNASVTGVLIDTQGGGGGTGDVVGPASASVNGLTVFDGTTGKLVKQMTGTGWVRLASGVIQVDPVPLPTSSEVSGTLTIASTGKMVPATGNVTINTGVYSAGDSLSVKNTTGSPITIIQGSGMTLELAGTATTGTRTLETKGICTLWFSSGTNASCIGAGLT